MLRQRHPTTRPAVERLADDIGQDPGTVRDLFGGPQDAPDRLRRMLNVLGHDPKTILWDRRLGRDMERVCSNCTVRRRCARWLKRAERRGPAERVETPGFCPNRGTFGDLPKLAAQSTAEGAALRR
jgi:hypothetical protein